MGLMQTISKAPKWLLLTGSAVLIAGGGYAVLSSSNLLKKKPVEQPGQVLIDIPDAPIDQFSSSATDAYANSAKNGRTNVADWWESMNDGVPEEDEISTAMDDELDPNVYSQLEITNIRCGVWTKAQVDEMHVKEKAEALERERKKREAEESQPKVKYYTPEQQDSMYFARLDKAYALANKYMANNSGEETPKEPEPPKEPERKLELNEQGALPSDSFTGDGIISSLETESADGVVKYSDSFRARPVKATFLKKEKIISGNRVIIRLMQDMQLSDGTVIPANTHITGICSVSNRLRIDIKRLNYNGRMFPVDISVYDNDGTEGIYCPMAEASQKTKRKIKEATSNILQTAGSAVTGLLMRSPTLGSMASAGVNAVTSSINDNGTITVNVEAGYEFYVYENVES